MNQLYKVIEISKQAFHQRMDRLRVVLSEQKQLLILIHQIREDHPTMGVRDMYYKLKPESMGRDAFEHFCKSENLMSMKPKNWHRTTDSTGVVRFDNQLINLTITRINQVWQSDITYFELNGRFYYITFIMDAYSRRILGYKLSKRLITEHTTLPALEMAIKLRRKESENLDNLIFHSDGGGQYYDRRFLRLTTMNNFINSMCEYAWENGKAERLNGVIKNNYLKHRRINSFEDLQQEVDRSVYLYNKEKPHIELQRKSPIEFENDYICKGQQTSGEKSVAELKTQRVKKKVKTVNVI